MNLECKNIDICNIVDLSSIKSKKCTFLVSDLHEFIKTTGGSYATLESSNILKEWITDNWTRCYLRSRDTIRAAKHKHRADLRSEWLQNTVLEIPTLEKRHIGKSKKYTLANFEDASDRTQRELLAAVETDSFVAGR